MTIEKGRDWGAPAADLDLEPDLVAQDDAGLAALAADGLRRGVPVVVGLTGGDLLATLGVEGDNPGRAPHAYPIDLGLAQLGHGPELPELSEDHAQHGPAQDDTVLPFVAHLIADGRGPIGRLIGRLLGHGPGACLTIMNGAWLGELRLGPRAHPNDGLVDITEGQVGLAQRREAVRRARTGSHVPHPALRTSRARRWETSFDRPTTILLDGVDQGRFRSLRVMVVPDAVTVVA